MDLKRCRAQSKNKSLVNSSATYIKLLDYAERLEERVEYMENIELENSNLNIDNGALEIQLIEANEIIINLTEQTINQQTEARKITKLIGDINVNGVKLTICTKCFCCFSEDVNVCPYCGTEHNASK